MKPTMGQIIKNLRKLRLLTQEELAEQLNVTYQAISKWENDTGLPDISQIVPLAHFFGVSTDVLFGTAEENYEEEITEAHEKFSNLGNKFDDIYASYAEIKLLLSKYPSSHTLSLDCLIICDKLIESEKCSEEEKALLVSNCERYASVLLAYSHDLSILRKTYSVMAWQYIAIGNFSKAYEYSRILSPSWDETQGALLAELYKATNDEAECQQRLKENIADNLSAMLSNIIFLGNSLRRNAADYDTAIAVYRKVKEISDVIFGDAYNANAAYQVCQSLGKVTHCYIETGDAEKAVKSLTMLYHYIHNAETQLPGESLLLNNCDNKNLELFNKWLRTIITSDDTKILLGSNSLYKKLAEVIGI